MQIQKREILVIASVIGGVVGLADYIVKEIGTLYQFAQTSQGLAAIVLASAMLSAASLAVSLIRRS